MGEYPMQISSIYRLMQLILFGLIVQIKSKMTAIITKWVAVI